MPVFREHLPGDQEQVHQHIRVILAIVFVLEHIGCQSQLGVLAQPIIADPEVFAKAREHRVAVHFAHRHDAVLGLFHVKLARGVEVRILEHQFPFPGATGFRGLGRCLFRLGRASAAIGYRWGTQGRDRSNRSARGDASALQQ